MTSSPGPGTGQPLTRKLGLSRKAGEKGLEFPAGLKLNAEKKPKKSRLTASGSHTSLELT